MSTDSIVAWRYLHAILKGKLDPEVTALKCGPLSHSRWLTCGMRCLLLYMSKHDLGPEDMEVLKLLATWVTQVYLPMFYEIKVKHDIKYGPWHLIKLFRLWQKQDARVKNASKPYLKTESWWAHPENEFCFCALKENADILFCSPVFKRMNVILSPVCSYVQIILIYWCFITGSGLSWLYFPSILHFNL